MATSGPDYFGAATAFKDVDWGFVGQHWWEDKQEVCYLCRKQRPGLFGTDLFVH